MRNDDVRRTNKQKHLLAIAQAWRFSLFGHIAQMPDETDVKTLTAILPRRNCKPPRSPCTMWMKTIQQDLKSNNLFLNEAINEARIVHSKTDVHAEKEQERRRKVKRL